jgi:hypothetical protein
MHQLGDTVSSVGGTCRDLSNRSCGIVAEAKHFFRNEQVEDVILIGRVHSKLGHAISQPGLIDISAKDRALILGGSNPADEMNELFSCVLGVWAREKK